MRFAPACLLLAGATLAPAGQAQAQAWREVMALGKVDPTVLRDKGVEAKIENFKIVTVDEHDDCRRPPQPDNATAFADIDAFGNKVAPKNECRSGEIDNVSVTATFPDHDPLDLPPDPLRNDAYPISVGVGTLGPGDANPAVIVEGNSGGAHCCATFQMAVMVDGAILTLGLPAMDGAPGTGFPADIDGDGMADIRRTDDAFLYSFSSYAASVAVPTIFNLREGKLVEVSAEPRFAPVYRDLAESALAGCTDKESAERGGACAAYAAAKARLGEAEEGIATAVANAGPSDTTEFEPTLRRLLKDRGYLDPPPLPSSEPPVDGPAPVLD